MALSVLAFAISQAQPLFYLMFAIIAIDAILGATILKQVFEDQRVDLECESTDLAYAPVLNETSGQKKYNNRLPEVVMDNEIGQKMFYRGWKFNMFNDMKQANKAIAAVSIIFAMFFFSLSSLATQILEHKKSDHQSLTLVIFTYAVICMFSYFNVAYVRDFDAIQVNITPIVLTMCGLVSLSHKYDFYLIGMVLSLLADSYCAIRFSESSDKIAFSVVERFAMESWCQDAFNKKGHITAQLVAICMIIAQVYLTLVGAHNGEQLCAVFLVFYIVRLVKFLLKTSIAVNIAQSNFVCLGLATIGIFSFFSGSMSMMTALSCAIMVADAILGAAMFVTLNQEDIYKELGLYQEFKKVKGWQGLNCQGHIQNLKMERISEHAE